MASTLPFAIDRRPVGKEPHGDQSHHRQLDVAARHQARNTHTALRLPLLLSVFSFSLHGRSQHSRQYSSVGNRSRERSERIAVHLQVDSIMPIFEHNAQSAQNGHARGALETHARPAAFLTFPHVAFADAVLELQRRDTMFLANHASCQDTRIPRYSPIPRTRLPCRTEPLNHLIKCAIVIITTPNVHLCAQHAPSSANLHVPPQFPINPRFLPIVYHHLCNHATAPTNLFCRYRPYRTARTPPVAPAIPT